MNNKINFGKIAMDMIPNSLGTLPQGIQLKPVINMLKNSLKWTNSGFETKKQNEYDEKYSDLLKQLPKVETMLTTETMLAISGKLSADWTFIMKLGVNSGQIRQDVVEQKRGKNGCAYLLMPGTYSMNVTHLASRHYWQCEIIVDENGAKVGRNYLRNPLTFKEEPSGARGCYGSFVNHPAGAIV